MTVKASTSLMKELKEFGLKDAGNCYHCGNCTGVCPLSTEDNPFPRKLVRMAQLGLEEEIVKSPEPWLCYYCGECSDLCPRGADPGETMMVMRRFLTSRYDWTGFAKKFYTSHTFEIVAVTTVALFIGLMFWLFADWSASRDVVQLTKFAPPHIIEILDLLMAAVLTFFLLSNVWRCIKIVMGEDLQKIPKKYYATKLWDLIWNTATQKQFGHCEDRMQWFVHLLIMTGYSSVFAMVVIGIRWFQRDAVINPEWPLITTIMTMVGYYATFAIMYGTTYALIGRIRKSKPQYKNSHSTDWMFLILLQLTTLTGIAVHITIFLGWPMPTYIIYVIHMMVAIPMLVLEVPFAKWAHLAYRPVVLFLTEVKKSFYAENPEPAVEPAAEEEAAAEAA